MEMQEQCNLGQRGRHTWLRRGMMVAFLASLSIFTTVLSDPSGVIPLASAQEQPSKPNDGSGGAPVDPARAKQASQMMAQNRIDKIIQQEPDSFAGSTTNGYGQMTVYTVQEGSQAREASLSEIAGIANSEGLTVATEARKYSLAKLQSIADQVRPDVEDPFFNGDVIGTQIDMDENVVTISVLANKVEAAKIEVERAFGDAARVVEGTEGIDAYGRNDDTSPFYGGGYLAGGGMNCTSGFSIRNLYNIPYMVTAGHCFALNLQVNNGTSGPVEGIVQYKKFPNNSSLDNELIGGLDYDGRMWGGGPFAPNPSYPVHSAGNTCLNCDIYFNGTYGENLYTMIGARFCSNFPSGYSCGLRPVNNNGQACDPGQSGGPVFAYDGAGGVIAVGIIKGKATPPGLSQSCVYTELPLILDDWQSTIAVG